MIYCNVDILKLKQLKYNHKFNITLGAPMGKTIITGGNSNFFGVRLLKGINYSADYTDNFKGKRTLVDKS